MYFELLINITGLPQKPAKECGYKCNTGCPKHIFCVIGGERAQTTFYGEVIEFDKKTKTWKEIGKLEYPRGFHAMSVVSIDDVHDYCKPEPTATTASPPSGVMIKK